MNFSKKGLSDIITNVLIILLVLVAVGIIWAFVRPTISQGAGGLQGAADCLTIELEPLSCMAGEVIVRRNVGAGDLAGIKIVGEDGTGENVVGEDTTSIAQISELETVNLNPGFVTAGRTVRVAAMIQTGEGLRTCPASAEAVTCTS